VLGLDEHVNRQGTGAWGPVPQKTMADTMEAVLGAVYGDGGVAPVRRVVDRLGLVLR